MSQTGGSVDSKQDVTKAKSATRTRPCFTFQQLKKYNNVDLLGGCECSANKGEQESRFSFQQPRIGDKCGMREEVCPNNNNYNKYRETLLNHIYSKRSNTDGTSEDKACPGEGKKITQRAYTSGLGLNEDDCSNSQSLPSSAFEALGQFFFQKMMSKEMAGCMAGCIDGSAEELPKPATQITNNYYQKDDKKKKKANKCKQSKGKKKQKCDESSESEDEEENEETACCCPTCCGTDPCCQYSPYDPCCSCYCPCCYPCCQPTCFTYPCPPTCPPPCHPPVCPPPSAPSNCPPTCPPTCPPKCPPKCPTEPSTCPPACPSACPSACSTPQGSQVNPYKDAVDTLLEQSLTNTVNDCQDLLLSLLNEKLVSDESFLEQICEQLISPTCNGQNKSNNASGSQGSQSELSSAMNSFEKISVVLDDIEHDLRRPDYRDGENANSLKVLGMKIKELKKELSDYHCTGSSSPTLVKMDQRSKIKTPSKMPSKNSGRVSFRRNSRSEASNHTKRSKVTYNVFNAERGMGDIKLKRIVNTRKSQLERLRDETNELIYQLEGLENDDSREVRANHSDPDQEEQKERQLFLHNMDNESVNSVHGDVQNRPSEAATPGVSREYMAASQKNAESFPILVITEADINARNAEKSDSASNVLSHECSRVWGRDCSKARDSRIYPSAPACHDDSSFLDLYNEFRDEDEDEDDEEDEDEEKTYKLFNGFEDDQEEEDYCLQRIRMGMCRGNNKHKNNAQKPSVSFTEIDEFGAARKRATEFCIKLQPKIAAYARQLQRKLKRQNFITKCQEPPEAPLSCRPRVGMPQMSECCTPFPCPVTCPTTNIPPGKQCPTCQSADSGVKKIRLCIEMKYPEDECQEEKKPAINDHCKQLNNSGNSPCPIYCENFNPVANCFI